MKRRPRPLFRCRKRGSAIHIGPVLDRTPNYQPLVDALVAEHRDELVPGEVRHVTIAHDAWCAIHRGRACDCDPEVKLLAPGEEPPSPATRAAEAN